MSLFSDSKYPATSHQNIQIKQTQIDSPILIFLTVYYPVNDGTGGKWTVPPTTKAQETEEGGRKIVRDRGPRQVLWDSVF